MPTEPTPAGATTITLIPGTDIPEEGQSIPYDVVINEHPAYRAEKLINDFHAAAYRGDGGFAADLSPWTTDDVPWDKATFDAYFKDAPQFNDTYLEPNLREGKKFERRLHRAWYRNIIKPAIRKLAGFLMKFPPERADLPTLTTKWLDSVSVGGLSMDRWLETEGIPWTLVYGKPNALLDRPGTDSLTRAQQEKTDDSELTVGIIHQSAVMDWSRNANDTYKWLKYIDIMDTPRHALSTESGERRRYRWITQDGWFYVDHDITTGEEVDPDKVQLKVTKSGLWKKDQNGKDQAELLNGAPLASGRLGESGESYIKDAAPAARAMYNNTSRRDNLLVQTAFPMVTAPGDSSPDDGPQVVGPNEIFEYDLEARHRPEWMSPDSGPFETYAKVEQALEDIINAMMGFTIASAGTSGVAKSFDMVELNRLLVSLSADCAEFELAILKVAAAMNNEPWPPNATSTWNNEFDATDLTALVDALTTLLRIGLGQTADQLLMRRVTNAALPNATSTEKVKIKAEQEAISQTRANADDDPDDDDIDDDDDFPDDGESNPPIKEPHAKSR